MGPTAIGKTDLSIKLAQKISAEIISSDTVQIHRYMDIGSAKPSKKERALIKHHLIDIKNPDEIFSSGEFVRTANSLIEKLSQKGKNVIIVGGGGFYIDSLVFGIDEIDSVDKKIKGFFDDICDEFSPAYLYEFLKIVDFRWASAIKPQDCQRIKRGLSVFVDKGVSISSFFSKTKKADDRFLIFVLYANRDFLNKRIEKRVNLMIESGLIDEVKRLVLMGYAETNALKSIGYKETIQYLEGKINLEELSKLIKKNTKLYAKRQLTFLRSRFSDAVWIDVEKEDGLQIMLDACKPYHAAS